MGNSCTKKRAHVKPADAKVDGRENYGVFFGDTVVDEGATRRQSAAPDDLVNGTEISFADICRYRFPFENIVLEGGGSKGLAYCGALEILEDLKGSTGQSLRSQMKRFAGASAGAMTAALYVVGYNSAEIREFLSQDLEKVLIDHSCGYFSLLPNLIRKFGWNPGKKIFKWFGDALKERTGDADITFKQIYDRYDQTELCIVVTNVNQMDTEYCHVKTTPDMPVRVAVRMSMAIPALFTASHYTINGHTNVYVDGGLLCNYPIHCFDGWFLSLKPEDGFLLKLQPLSELAKIYEKNQRFGGYNDKTLGFVLYACNEQDLYRTELDSRPGMQLPQKFPNTALFQKYSKDQQASLHESNNHGLVVEAVNALLKTLSKSSHDEDPGISFKEFSEALSKGNEFTLAHRKVLSWENETTKEIFNDLVRPGQDDILVADIFRFLEQCGVKARSMFTGYRRREVTTLFEFLDTLQMTLTTNVKKLYMEEHDVRRTVGINSVYLGTTDFNMMPEDKTFLVEQGRRATLAYLRYYIKEHGRKMDEEQQNTAAHADINQAYD